MGVVDLAVRLAAVIMAIAVVEAAAPVAPVQAAAVVVVVVTNKCDRNNFYIKTILLLFTFHTFSLS